MKRLVPVFTFCVLFSGCASAYFNKGMNLYNTGRFHDASELLARSAELNPGDAMTCYYLGLAYDKAGSVNRAMGAYTRALALDSRMTKAWINRGVLYLQMNQYNDAVADFSRAVALNNQDSVPYYNRGIAYYRLRNYGLAIADFGNAINIHGNDADYFVMRANALARTGKYREAVADYREALRLAPDNAEARQNLRTVEKLL